MEESSYPHQEKHHHRGRSMEESPMLERAMELEPKHHGGHHRRASSGSIVDVFSSGWQEDKSGIIPQGAAYAGLPGEGTRPTHHRRGTTATPEDSKEPEP